jgi:hypothetical protein
MVLITSERDTIAAMSEKYVAISQHNVDYWELDQLSDQLTEPIDLHAPVLARDQIILMGLHGDIVKIWPDQATLTVARDDEPTHEKGLVITRTDGDHGLLQAQSILKKEEFPPFGKTVFRRAVSSLAIFQHKDSHEWRIGVDSDNINRPSDLNYLVWALTRNTRKKQAKGA